VLKYREATEVRKDFLRIAAEGDSGDTVAVTKHGRPVLAVMPWGLYETLMETVGIANDPAILDSIAKGEAAIREGKTITLDELSSSLA
jgi:prevent-host-death family protein